MLSANADFRISSLDLTDQEEIRFLYETRRHPAIAMWLFGVPPADIDSHKAWITANVPSKRLMYVARSGDTLIGYCHVSGYYKSGPIELGFVIHPDWQGKGYGGKMVDLLVETMVKIDSTRDIILQVKSDNEHACRLYEQHGFCITKYSDGVMNYVWKRP